MKNQKGMTLVEFASFLAVAVFVLFTAWYLFVGRPMWKEAWWPGNQESAVSSSSMGEYIEMSTIELESWRSSQYNVDVKINSSHAWLQHGVDAQNALKCMNRNGTLKDVGAFSETGTRNLHLFCREANGDTYVVIITKIRRAVDVFSNATADLVTAFKLPAYQTLEQYLYNELVTKNFGIMDKLWFTAGELYFMPY